MGSTPNCARQSETLAAASTALFVCTAADTTLPCDFASLPLPVALSIFALLPADARARAAAVCQAWRHALTAEPSAWKLWTELDLSEKSGITCARGDAALEGAAALARGRLRTLKLHNFSGNNFHPHTFTDAALLRVVTANAGLEELVSAPGTCMTVEHVQALLAAAPALRRLVTCAWADTAATARALLRREPPYGALRLLGVGIKDKSAASPLRDSNGVIALAADAAACESLRQLAVHYANLQAPEAMRALVDAVLARRLWHVELYECTFAPAVALPQLARLIADGRAQLRGLVVEDSPTLFEDAGEEDVEALRAAVAQSRHLRYLTLRRVGLWGEEKLLVQTLLRGALALRPAGSSRFVSVSVE